RLSLLLQSGERRAGLLERVFEGGRDAAGLFGFGFGAAGYDLGLVGGDARLAGLLLQRVEAALRGLDVALPLLARTLCVALTGGRRRRTRPARGARLRGSLGLLRRARRHLSPGARLEAGERVVH